MNIQNGSETKMQTLALTVQSNRWTQPVDVSSRSIAALQTRFQGIMGQKGIHDRKVRLRLASALAGRAVDSFSDLFGGEVRTLLNDPDLKEVLHYMIDRENSDA